MPPSEMIDQQGREMSRERNWPLAVSAIRFATRFGCIDRGGMDDAVVRRSSHTSAANRQ